MRTRLALAATLALGLAASFARAAESETVSPDDRARAISSRLLRELTQPRALADLYRLYELRDDVDDVDALARTLDAVTSAPRTRPDARALSRVLRSMVARAQGRLAQARALIESAAPVRDFAIIGPFDNEGRAGLTAVYGPERDGYEPKAVYPGKEHEVRWRTVSAELFPTGFVDLSGMIAPSQNTVVYAAAALRLPRARRAIFHLGASGATRLCVNGKLVHEDPALHPSRFDQRNFAVALRAGDNAVLLKIAHTAGRLGFSLRLGDEADAPLADVARRAHPPRAGQRRLFASESARGPIGQDGAARGDPPLRDALDELRDAARMHPEDARAQEDLAIVLGARQSYDEGERLALRAQERAADAAPTDPDIALRLAKMEDRDFNKRRDALERALAAHPSHPNLLEALATLRLERGDAFAALQLATLSRAAAPSALRTQLVWAQALDAAGLRGRAARARIEAARAHPGSARAHRAAAAGLRFLGRPHEARGELSAALALRFDDGEARAELTGLLLDAGDFDSALSILREAAALDPASLPLSLRTAELLSQNGRREEAERAYARGLELAPDDAEAHLALGRHRLRAQDDAGALAAFTRALSLRPQNPGLRDLLRTLRPEENYAAPYLYDAARLSRAPFAPGADDDQEVLADLTVTKVFGNGLSSRTRQLIVRALSPRGADQARVQSVSYSPDRQVLRVERARILRRDGTELEARSQTERGESDPAVGLYYDLRTRSIVFGQIEPGDTVELVLRLEDSGNNFFADYFGDFVYLQGFVRKRVADYVLLAPPGRAFYATATKLPGLVHEERQEPDGGTVQRWTAREVLRLVPEPGMPGTSDLLGYLHISTYRDWDSVGRFYWGLIKDQLRVTDEIRAAAREAVRGVPESDEQARIRAVYDFVVSRTRYVALEFGINSFKPYPVETVLSRRFGDCKDKASLMHAMLESLGIDSRIALLRMRRLGNIEQAPASLAVFNHAILYVPKYDLFLDGTADFHGSAELPAEDHGAEALIVEPSGGSRFLRTPEAQPSDNFDETGSKVSLREDGSASLELTRRAQGFVTAELRRTFESPDERRARAEERLSHPFPGVKVTAVEVSDPHDIESPFVTRLRATAPGFAQPSGGGLRFSPFGQGQSFVEAYAQLSRRSLPERLPPPQRTLLRAEVSLPPGWNAVVPEEIAEKGPQGSFAVRYAREGGNVFASLDLTLSGNQIAPQEYPAFRAFLARLDAALLRKVEAGPALTAAGGVGR